MSTTTNYITFKLWSFCKMTSDDGVETTWEVRGVSGDVMTIRHRDFLGSYDQAWNGGGCVKWTTRQVKIEAGTYKLTDVAEPVVILIRLSRIWDLGAVVSLIGDTISI